MDAVLLFPILFVCIVVLEQLLLAMVLAGAAALIIRVLKWGRLPGYTLDLLVYLLLPAHLAALGRDRAPPYPLV